MHKWKLLNAGGLSVLMMALVWSLGIQQQPHLHPQPPKPTSAYDQPLTGYEVAVLTAEFVVNLERGLTEAFQKPISTAPTGKVTLTARHPEWVRPALIELKGRGMIPKTFQGTKPMPRYQVGMMMAEYARRLDKRMRSVLGDPVGRTTMRVQPPVKLERKHPAYNDLRFLASGGWVGAGSPLYSQPMQPILGKELPDILRDVAQRILERYRNEPHMQE